MAVSPPAPPLLLISRKNRMATAMKTTPRAKKPMCPEMSVSHHNHLQSSACEVSSWPFAAHQNYGLEPAHKASASMNACRVSARSSCHKS